MTIQIALVLGILLLALALFLDGRIRVDLVALLVLALLALTGLVTPIEAFSGFGNPAVITIWAVFILSGGLSRTGVARGVGRRLLRLAGSGERRLLAVLMLAAACLSAVMNNVAVVALLLPVTMDIARSTGQPPARLLLPLAYASLLGGLTTLIGTNTNILVADLLRQSGERPFGLFDYTPLGGSIMIAGILFLLLLGHRLLPRRDPARESVWKPERAAGGPPAPEHEELEERYRVRERLFTVRVGPGSPLEGRPLAESRLGSALGLNVIAILRGGRTHPAPAPGETLRAGDRLVVQGRPDRLAGLRGRRALLVPEESLAVERLAELPLELAEVRVEEGCPALGRTLRELDFRIRHGLNVLAIRRDGTARRDEVQDIPLRAGDRLIVQGPRDMLDALRAEPGYRVTAAERAELARLQERLLAVRVPAGSLLAGRTLSEVRLGDAFGLSVLSIVRGGRTLEAPDPEEALMAGDLLLVEGEERDLETIAALQALEVEEDGPPGQTGLRSERVGLVEAILAPQSPLAGKTLRELDFRDKYGLTVLAVLRGGELLREGLRDLPLRMGDALLLYGPADRLRVLGREPDFLVLTRSAEKRVRASKAPLAVLIMAGVLLSVLVGWLPIAVAAVSGATLMVLTGCLTMDEAYRDIDWRAVFLIAGTLPLGIALERTGAAGILSEGLVSLVGGLGPPAAAAGVFAITALGAQAVPTAALVVLLSPVVLNTAAALDLSPHSLMMVLAMAASSSFASPISHPVNVLVMGPGGYRFRDYQRIGLPLTGLVFLLVMLLTPLLWPYRP